MVKGTFDRVKELYTFSLGWVQPREGGCHGGWREATEAVVVEAILVDVKRLRRGCRRILQQEVEVM